jgi:NADPH:quinone reductase-like Zn-dependent oxidoreductase
MKAVRFHEYGGVDKLLYEDVPQPAPGPGEVLIRVGACAVNHVDIDMREGTSRLPLQLPHTLGFEIAGEVAAVGEDVENVSAGDRVSPLYQIHCRRCAWCAAGQHHHCENITMLGVRVPGGYAEYTVAPAWALIRLPEGMSYEVAAAIQTTFGTVWHALVARVGLQSGQTVLVNAAGSGVGSAGIQVARWLGAWVIASAGSDDKLERARAQGAEAAINYATEDLTARVRALTAGRGVDVVMESVGGEVFTASLNALAKDGKLVTVGGHGGEVVPLDIIPLFRNQWSVIGSVRATADEIKQVIGMVADGMFQPVIYKTYPLADARQAHQDMAARRHYGKLVLVL